MADPAPPGFGPLELSRSGSAGLPPIVSVSGEGSDVGRASRFCVRQKFHVATGTHPHASVLGSQEGIGLLDLLEALAAAVALVTKGHEQRGMDFSERHDAVFGMLASRLDPVRPRIRDEPAVALR